MTFPGIFGQWHALLLAFPATTRDLGADRGQNHQQRRAHYLCAGFAGPGIRVLPKHGVENEEEPAGRRSAAAKDRVARWLSEAPDVDSCLVLGTRKTPLAG